jgi:hypothetical protein
MRTQERKKQLQKQLELEISPIRKAKAKITP